LIVARASCAWFPCPFQTDPLPKWYFGWPFHDSLI